MKWKILHKVQSSIRQLADKDQSKEIIKILLENRGVKTNEQQDIFLNPSLSELDQDFFDKKQLKVALQRIKKAIENKEQIIIYSDYDVDGITGAAILWETLDGLSANVMPYVPSRMEEGYGMSTKGIDKILSQYPDAKLIITVDHGITAVEQTKYAKEKDLDVIITDHHTIGPNLPKADAIIHTTELSGSGVAYVFSRKIIRHSDPPAGGEESIKLSAGSFSLGDTRDQDDNVDEHLALAALGTIADLVPLVGPNRVIAKYGLEALNKTKRIGLLMLIDAIGISDRKIGTYEVGFMIAPRINASGRLTHALDALRLLCTKSPTRAKELSQLLIQTNTDRQFMMTSSNDHAKTLVTGNKKLLFIAHETYHEGVIGLVAGRLVEEYYRPAIVIAKGEKYSKASARSIHGFNIVEAIRNCSDILVNVGGHPMAAGFTVETSYLSILEERLIKVAEEQIGDELLERQLRIDIEIPFDSLSHDLYKNLQQLSPFGMGNPEPLFATNSVDIVDAVTVGNERQHLKMKVKQEKNVFNTIGFGMGERYSNLKPETKIDIVYTLTINTWNGTTNLQLKLKDFKDSS